MAALKSMGTFIDISVEDLLTLSSKAAEFSRLRAMQPHEHCHHPAPEDYKAALKSMNTFLDITIEDLLTLSSRAVEFCRLRIAAANSVSGIMTKPVQTVCPETPLREAAQLLVNKKISGLPVADYDNRLCGIISEGDFLQLLGVPAPHPHYNLWYALKNQLTHVAQPDYTDAPHNTVGAHMSKQVITAREDDDIRFLLELMKKHQVKRIVILDHSQFICGIVTRSDLVKWFFQKLLTD
ncbi:MAG: CBS domain-containing protein [Thiothrix sp.]